jgi:NAD(P)-dependent dehydrogenase (short-subunit alcohol dehydrogenase family)
MTKPTGRVALVTGGASGIGRGIAEALLARGVAVAVCDLRPDALEATFGDLRSAGRVAGHVLDVTDRAALRRVVDAVESDLGAIDILVNNAGVGYSGTPLHETPDEDIDWVIDVNLRAVLSGIRTVVPRMVGRRRGHVLNVASMSGLAVPTGIQHGLYAATKAGVVFLSEGLRQDVGALGIGVSVLCPGYVRSNLPWSASYRTGRHGGPSSRAPSAGVLRAMERALDPRAVGERTVDAMERGEFLILTDLGEAGDVTAWHARVRAALDALG